jgi:hypothetical protein
VSDRRKAEKNGKSWWDSEELDGDPTCRRGSRIASQALFPRESPMSALCTGKRARGRGVSRWGRLSQSAVNALGTKKLDHLPPMGAPLPISPQDRIRSGQGRWWRRRGGCCVEWPENGTDAARFLGGSAIALAFLPQRTGTAMADAGCIDHAQATIAFRTALLRIEGEASGTAKGAICLGSEVRTCNASLSGDGPLRWSVGHVCLF